MFNLACTVLIYTEILGIVRVPWDLFVSGLWRTMYLHPYHHHFARFHQGIITNSTKYQYLQACICTWYGIWWFLSRTTCHIKCISFYANFRLRKKSWEMIQLNDFACPPIMVKAGAVLPQGSKHQIFRPPM